GTVYKKTSGEIIAKSFPKFFNFSELPLDKQRLILNGTGLYKSYDVYEKLDGSLGIVYHDGRKWRVNTRGSFTSDQAIKATQMLKEYNMELADKNITYLVEIIYPENKIIVDYGVQEKLVLLAKFNKITGEEIKYGVLSDYINLIGFDVPEMYSLTIEEMIELQKTIPKNCEGFVVRFSNGERVKIKGLEYLRIARILKGCSPLSLWGSMSNGTICQTFIESIPEEIIDEIKPIIKTLEDNYRKILKEINRDYLICKTELNLEEITPDTRKALGLFLKDNKLTHSTVMFSIFLGNNKGLEKYIMSKIRPKGNSLDIGEV
ncbi:MAG: RNA ligase, partial [Nitrososphaeraceae archaeon]|nr:RNA ligase [Nitrososphaeraceae archaeon]